jgi:alpha-glucosidase
VPADLFQINPNINIEELFAHAKAKNVGIILWMLWNALDKDLDRALDLFEKWGAKGIKVDFMQRDDQKMVNYYEKVVKAAAARKLLVDFHGSYKPTGLQRAYPNALTREGVRGLEWNKCEGRNSQTRRDAAVHSHVRRADGFYPRRDDQRQRGELPRHF